MRKESLNNLTLAEHIKVEGVGRKQEIIYLIGLCEWMIEQRQREIEKGNKLL